jgi:hypothetical protein
VARLRGRAIAARSLAWRNRTQRRASAGIEPPLAELLNDRIVQLIMGRDGIELADVWRAVEAARSCSAEGTPHATQEACGLNPSLEIAPIVATDRHIRSPPG